MLMRIVPYVLVLLCLTCTINAEEVCKELTEVMNTYYEKYDSLEYNHHEELALGCPDTPLSKNPFFPGVAVVMYLFLKVPGECVLSSCSAEKEAWETKHQNCGTRADWELPWHDEPKAGLGQLNWDSMICGPSDGSYFKSNLPELSECDPLQLTSVASVKQCLIAAEMTGKLGYCSRAQSNKALHEYNVPAMYITWHRELAKTGVPPPSAVVMGFSFGKGKPCTDLMDCTDPGKTNELLASTAVQHLKRHKDTKLALQFEVAVAAKLILQAEDGISLNWVPHPHHESVKKLEGYEIYALGGFNDKYLNTADVYDIGAGFGGRKGLIVLAHPSHMPRVYRTISAHGADMSEVFLSLSPLPLDWTDKQSTAGEDYNMFAERSTLKGQGSNLKTTSVWDQLTQEPTWGMDLSSTQEWTREALTFSLSEFWVYPLQMLPGRLLLGSLPDDLKKLPICGERIHESSASAPQQFWEVLKKGIQGDAAWATIICVCSVGFLCVAAMIAFRSYRKAEPDAALLAESDEAKSSDIQLPEMCSRQGSTEPSQDA